MYTLQGREHLCQVRDFVPVVLVVLQDFPERRVAKVSAIPKVPRLLSNLFMRVFVPLVRGHACQHMVHSDSVVLYQLDGMICAVLRIMLSIFFWVAIKGHCSGAILEVDCNRKRPRLTFLAVY